MRMVSKIEPKVPQLHGRKRVAAYARVSMESERLQHSLSAQVSYYSKLIQSHPEWEYAGVFADDGISGTSTVKRNDFNRLMAECEAGRIDIILTKSISRFARNTLDVLKTVRRLKELGIEVRFEKENISSLDEKGELMLTLLASFAQEESRSISENVKWGTVKRFKQGIPNGHFMIYGYRWEGDHLVIQPEEAKIVRLIYDNFQKGLSAEVTEKQLAEMGVLSLKGVHFCNTSIRQILRNVTYTGNLLFQKEYTVDPISGKSKINRGDLPQYWVENSHEAIIPLETYRAVQDEIARRRALGARANPHINTGCFTSKIKCGRCGMSYQRSSRRGRKDPNYSYIIWTCGTRKQARKPKCDNKDIPERMLRRACADVLGLEEFDEAVFTEQIDHVVIPAPNEMVFYFHDGRVVPHHWESTMHEESWTAARRAQVSAYRRDRDSKYGTLNTFTHFIKCGRCGANYRCQDHTLTNGQKVRSWYCASPTSVGCSKQGIKDDEIKRLAAEALGIPEFDLTVMDEQMDYATVRADSELAFHFRDGHEVTKTIVRKRKLPPQTEERKRHMSEMMKEYWRKKHAEDNNHSSND